MDAWQGARSDNHHARGPRRTGSRVPSASTLESGPRAINEPTGRRDATVVGGASVAGMILGAAAGGALGLLLALFPGVPWWAGLMVGAIVGLTLAASVLARLGLRDHRG